MSKLPVDSATARSIHPKAIWSTEAYMLAGVLDLLAGANWQRAGKKSAPKPKPVRRPGDDRTRIGAASPHTAAKFEALYARALGRIESGEVTWQSK